MGGIWAWMKVKFYPLHLIFGYVFVVSGLIVCFLMLLTYMFVWPFNKTLYRKIVVNLVYTHWCRKYIATLIANITCTDNLYICRGC